MKPSRKIILKQIRIGINIWATRKMLKQSKLEKLQKRLQVKA